MSDQIKRAVSTFVLSVRREEVGVLTQFVNEVCLRAEEKMLETGKLEGAHYAAMRQVYAEIMQNLSSKQNQQP